MGNTEGRHRQGGGGQGKEFAWIVCDVATGSKETHCVEGSLPQQYVFDYVRFFDQYAKDMTAWAPDSKAFSYASDLVCDCPVHLYIVCLCLTRLFIFVGCYRTACFKPYG